MTDTVLTLPGRGPTIPLAASLATCAFVLATATSGCSSSSSTATDSSMTAASTASSLARGYERIDAIPTTGPVTVTGFSHDSEGNTRTITHVVGGIAPLDDPNRPTPGRYRRLEIPRTKTIELLDGFSWARIGEEPLEALEDWETSLTAVELVEPELLEWALRDFAGGDQEILAPDRVDEVLAGLETLRARDDLRDQLRLALGGMADDVESPILAAVSRADWSLERPPLPGGGEDAPILAQVDDRISRPVEALALLTRAIDGDTRDPKSALTAYLPWFVYPFILTRRSAGGARGTDVLTFVQPDARDRDRCVVWYAYVESADPERPMDFNALWDPAANGAGDPNDAEPARQLEHREFARLDMRRKTLPGSDTRYWFVVDWAKGSLSDLAPGHPESPDGAEFARHAIRTAFEAVRCHLPNLPAALVFRDEDAPHFWSAPAGARGQADR